MFLVILIIVIACFAFISIAVSRAGNINNLPAIAVSVLLICGCVVGMIVVVGSYLGEMGLCLYMIAVVYSFFFLLWGIHYLFHMQSRIHRGVLGIFVSYLLAVIYITIFMREPGSNDRMQMEVFNWLKEDSVESVEHIFLNVAMFFPVGVIFPFITDGFCRRMISSASFGLLFSTLIETGQFLLHSGTCDIDDILSNSLGALAGAAVATVGMHMRRRTKEENGKKKTDF